MRRRVLAAVGLMSEAQREDESARARALLEAQPVWCQAEAVLLYAPMPGELDVWPLVLRSLAEGRRVLLPRYDPGSGSYLAAELRDAEADLSPGRYGVREPRAHCPGFPLNRLDLALVPGVAYDAKGHRLGRGQGYYDRLLSVAGGLACGVAFETQWVAVVPVEAHDMTVDFIVTPTRWHPVRTPAA